LLEEREEERLLGGKMDQHRFAKAGERVQGGVPGVGGGCPLGDSEQIIAGAVMPRHDVSNPLHEEPRQKMDAIVGRSEANCCHPGEDQPWLALHSSPGEPRTDARRLLRSEPMRAACCVLRARIE